jgi:tyrosyl-tRNA synthetase
LFTIARHSTPSGVIKSIRDRMHPPLRAGGRKQAVKSVAEQLSIIERGAEQIEPSDELLKKLERSVKTGKPLRVKYGIDPTGIDVHLGHTVPLRKMRQFQDLGHQAVLIIGDYTALVGDPSGRDQTRARLTPEQVAANAREYLTQVSKVIDIKRTEVHHNGDWFSKMGFLDVLTLMSKITLQRILERDDFTKRFRSEPSVPIYLHECLYPLMQGQDSVEIKADVELGGSEQLFNLMRGRQLQQDAGQEPQICLTLPILRGRDGERRMGKSLGNYVGVGESAREQFGKIMSIPDSLMREWFTLLTDRPVEEIARLADGQQTHPRQAKERLAQDVVAFYHGADAAEDFRKQFSCKQDPDEIPVAQVSVGDLIDGRMGIAKLLVALELAKSNNDARRLIQQGGVNLGPEREKVTDINLSVPVTSGLVIRVGRKVLRIQLA